MTPPAIDPALRSLLQWYAEMGALDGVGDAALGLYSWSKTDRPQAPLVTAASPPPPRPNRTTPAKALPVDEAIGAAERAAPGGRGHGVVDPAPAS
ncbi:MAG: hypothetical protein K2Q06_01780 [Parvularculaceae bacterium]|nr:hypothetical protein [Parvularculaceae bacterium]